jgi:hypothetical protein
MVEERFYVFWWPAMWMRILRFVVSLRLWPPCVLVAAWITEIEWRGGPALAAVGGDSLSARARSGLRGLAAAPAGMLASPQTSAHT